MVFEGPPGFGGSHQHRHSKHPGQGDANILHVDMDAFYASVEVLLEPALAGQPVLVGGSGRRGVVASASYEARAYGCRSAMPSAEARRLCPQAVFVPGRYDRYTEYSRRLHEIFLAYTPLVEGIALDEAFLDVAGATRLFGSGPAIAQEIRRQIKEELGLSASVGVAASKFIAKLAAEAAKPRASLAGVAPGPGVVVVEPGDELRFVHPLPVEALWGVGPATSDRLRRLGVTTIGDLAQVPLPTLELALGSANARQLHELSWARDHRPVEVDREVKSVGHEETYAWDRDNRDDLHRELVRMSDAVAARLRATGLTGRTITVKVRFSDFHTITRSLTLNEAVDTAQAIGHTAAGLLDQVDVVAGVRLLGLSVSAVGRGSARQLALGLGSPSAEDDAEGHGDVSAMPSWRQAALAVDRVRARFGDTAVGPAVLIDGGRLRLKRQGDTQWGPNETQVRQRQDRADPRSAEPPDRDP